MWTHHDPCIILPMLIPPPLSRQGIAFDNGCPLCDNDARCEPNTYDYTGTLYEGKGATSVRPDQRSSPPSTHAPTKTEQPLNAPRPPHNQTGLLRLRRGLRRRARAVPADGVRELDGDGPERELPDLLLAALLPLLLLLGQLVLQRPRQGHPRRADQPVRRQAINTMSVYTCVFVGPSLPIIPSPVCARICFVGAPHRPRGTRSVSAVSGAVVWRLWGVKGRWGGVCAIVSRCTWWLSAGVCNLEGPSRVYTINDNVIKQANKKMSEIPSWLKCFAFGLSSFYCSKLQSSYVGLHLRPNLTN